MPTGAKSSSSAVGLGVAAAVVAIAGLTWLFTSKPAQAPAESAAPAATEAPAEPQKSEAAPAAAEPAPASPPAAAPAQEASKAAAPAAPEHGKKKKKHH